MRETVPHPLPLLALAMCAAIGLTSCASSSSTGSNSHPPPVKPTTHVAVADTGDNRVLIYDAPLSPTSTPTTVIGQASFTKGSPNQGGTTASAATVYNPQGIAVDSAGNLWVADLGNCRVLEFKAPFTTGMSASLLIGQSSFANTGMKGGQGCNTAPTLSPSSLEAPVSVALDSKGDLWVADEDAGRINEYVPPFSSGMAASLVIGQSNLEDAYPCNGADYGEHGPAAPPTAATLCGVVNIAFDSLGNLWVGDSANLRVLEFVPPFTTGMAASGVLGQPDATVFTGNAQCKPSASTFCGTTGLAFDAQGDLWISDWEMDRVTEFVPPFETGMAGSAEIGQPNFTVFGPSPAATMFYPSDLAFDSRGDLLVTNGNSEILIYTPPLSTAINPAMIVSSGLGSCPPPHPEANTRCFPAGVEAF